MIETELVLLHVAQEVTHSWASCLQMKIKRTEAFGHNLYFARASAEPRLTPLWRSR